MNNTIDILIKNATLSKDKVALTTYKNIKAELQKALTAKNAPNYSEDLLLQIIIKYSKNLEDAIIQFSEAGREDLVLEYTNELEVVKKLLPAPVSAQELYDELLYWAEKNNFINDEIAYNIQIPKKEMGIAIKYLKKKFPSVDGKLISDIVKENSVNYVI